MSMLLAWSAILVKVVFVLILGVFLFLIFRSSGQSSKNRKQPVYSDPVLVKDKRTHVWGGGNTSSANTSYYITFEFENGERQEFMVSGKVYGEVAPGDTGTLTWQGTRFHDFQRARL